MAKQQARTATDANAAILSSFAKKEERPKKGVKVGLRLGETRVTCVLSDAQNQVLHDWAKTTGRTFREVTMAMADKYIGEVIGGAFAASGGKLKRGEKEPPEEFAQLYETEADEDEFAEFF